MDVSLWQKCLNRLENELPEQQFNTWIRPLHAIEEEGALRLLAPNRFVLDWVRDHYIDSISETVTGVADRGAPRVRLEIGTHKPRPASGRIRLPDDDSTDFWTGEDRPC